MVYLIVTKNKFKLIKDDFFKDILFVKKGSKYPLYKLEHNVDVVGVDILDKVTLEYITRNTRFLIRQIFSPKYLKYKYWSSVEMKWSFREFSEMFLLENKNYNLVKDSRNLLLNYSFYKGIMNKKKQFKFNSLNYSTKLHNKNKINGTFFEL